MKLSKNERHSLLGPLVVGIVFGGFVSFGVVAFDSEYGQFVHPGSAFPAVSGIAFEATWAFFCAAGGTILLLGVLPLAIGRLSARAAAKRDA